MANILNKLEHAKRILQNAELQYPIFAIYEGVTYRVDGPDAEPVSVTEIEDQEDR